MAETSRHLAGRAVLTVGGGIAGLAAALAASRRGADVHLCEQADAITEVGAGLQISPNGVAVLDNLGLSETARKVGQELSAVELIDGLSGALVTRIPMNRHNRPYLAFHRADLISMLLEAAEGAGAAIETGRSITSEDLPASELVFAADGIHSRIRSGFNAEQDLFFTGQVAWRATIVPPSANPDPVARVYMGHGQHVVAYPLRHGRLINIVAVREAEAWRQDGWSIIGDPLELREGFEALCPDVQSLLQRVEAPGVWGLFRRPIAENWHNQDGIALLGDAAHPTLPFLAQGANMALEDAWVLVDELDRRGTIDGLAAYQRRRRPRVARAISMANKNAQNYHLSQPLVRSLAHSALRLGGQVAPRLVASRFDWLYDHDVTQTR